MTTQIYSIEDQDRSDSRTLSLALTSLPQDEIDMLKQGGASYEKLYHLHSLAIEEIAAELLLLGAVGGDYLQTLSRLFDQYPHEAATAKLSAGVYTPESISNQLAALEQLLQLSNSSNPEVAKRNRLLMQAAEQGLTVVEITDPADGCLMDTPQMVEVVPQLADPEITPVDPRNRDRNQVTRGIEIITRAMKKPGPMESVNLGAYSHIAITKVLRHFLYISDDIEPKTAPIGYSDGSQSKGIALCSLTPLSDNPLVRYDILNVGMMSDRHPDLDLQIDFYWYRNQAISSTRPMAETDDIAYAWSKDLLAKARSRGPLRMAFYQTGFIPPVLGFYRAVIEELLASRNDQPWLEVIPMFYGRGGYEAGDSWV